MTTYLAKLAQDVIMRQTGSPPLTPVSRNFWIGVYNKNARWQIDLASSYNLHNLKRVCTKAPSAEAQWVWDFPGRGMRGAWDRRHPPPRPRPLGAFDRQACSPVFSYCLGLCFPLVVATYIYDILAYDCFMYTSVIATVRSPTLQRWSFLTDLNSE